jgi:hypothetical protein
VRTTLIAAPQNDANAPVPAQSLDHALQFGPAMRVQRLVEAGFMLAAIFTQDVRFAYVTLLLTALQVLSPRWVPVAQLVARIVPLRGGHRIGDLYFDLGGVRGASAISVLVQAVGIGLIQVGFDIAGFVLLTLPTASFLLAPTLGFCCGCWFYVVGRDWLARRGWLKEGFDDGGDIAIVPEGERDSLAEADRLDRQDQPKLPA